MPIKLLVTQAGDDSAPDEYVFDHATVSIGRDSANLLTLPDPGRVVSKHHAEVRDTGVAFQLVDLGSKNFTYLNGQRLSANEPAALNPGDAFTVGEFQLRFFPEAAPEPEQDRTVFAASFVNPFAEPAEQLATVLGDLRRVFATESGPHRTSALREALDEAMLGGGDEPGSIVAEALGGSAGASAGGAFAPPVSAPPPYQPPPPAYEPPVLPPFDQAPPAAPYAPSEPPPPLPAFDPPPYAPPTPPPTGFPPAGLPPAGLPPEAPPAYQPPAPPAYEPASPPAYSPPPPPAYTPPMSAPAASAPDGRVDRLVGALAAAVSKLVAIPWQFRREFIGQTMVQAKDEAFLFEKSPSELKDFLLDSRADAGELERRLQAIDDATEAAVVHQLAMLDGYKASVQDGAQRLLDEVNPDPVEAEVEASNPMYKVPQLRAAAVVERLKETHRELSGEDWSVAERRAFRPAFIKAYLARMTRRRS